MVVSKFPSEMLVYIHLEKGRLAYLSGRSIAGKQHYNPPREILGERRPYYNHLYSADAEQVALVEGQADAITFGEWGIPALAIAGMHVSDDLLTALRQHRRVFVALDNTPEALEKSREIARKLGSIAFIPRLPEEVKDANDWLTQGGTIEAVQETLNKAKTWLQTEIERTAFLVGLERKDAVRDLFQHAVDLDELRLSRSVQNSPERGSCAISVKLRWIASQHAEAQQVKLCSPKHLSLHEFQAIHLSFDQPVAPRERQRGSDSVIIPQYAPCEAPKFSNRGVKGTLEPVVESLHLLFTQQAGKRLYFGRHLGDIGMNSHKLLNLLMLSIGQRLRRREQQPGSAPWGQLFGRIGCW